MNTYDEWQVDLPNRSATHSSGLRITVEGPPANPSAVYPGPFPGELSALKQVQLLREGMLAIAASFKAQRAEAQQGGSREQDESGSVYSKPYRKSHRSSDGAESSGSGHSNRHGQTQGERKSPARHVTSGFLRSGRQAQQRAQQRSQHQSNGHQSNGHQKDYQGKGYQGKAYQSGGRPNGGNSNHHHSVANSSSRNTSSQRPHRDQFSADTNRRSNNKFQGNGGGRYNDKPYSANGNQYKKPNTPYFPSDSNNPSSYGSGYNRRVLAADQLKAQSRRGGEALSDDHFKERSAQRATSGNTAVKTINKVSIKRAPSKVASSDKDKKPLLSLKDKS